MAVPLSMPIAYDILLCFPNLFLVVFLLFFVVVFFLVDDLRLVVFLFRFLVLAGVCLLVEPTNADTCAMVAWMVARIRTFSMVRGKVSSTGLLS